MIINAYIGEVVTEEEILSIPCDIIKLDDGSYFLEKFCFFQYGELSESCKPHRKYIQTLKNLNLYERVSKGYLKGIHTLQEKEEDKDKEEDKEKVKRKKVFKAPTLEDVKIYFQEKGYTESSAIRAFNYYDAADWIDGKGDKVKNWKQKMNGVWFKDENKIKVTNANPFLTGMN
jgi:hypothetical protein